MMGLRGRSTRMLLSATDPSLIYHNFFVENFCWMVPSLDLIAVLCNAVAVVDRQAVAEDYTTYTSSSTF